MDEVIIQKKIPKQDEENLNHYTQHKPSHILL